MVDFKDVISRKGAVDTLCILYVQDEYEIVGVERMRQFQQSCGMSDMTSRKRLTELEEAGLIMVEQESESNKNLKTVRLTKYGKIIAKAVLKAERRFKEDAAIRAMY